MDPLIPLIQAIQKTVAPEQARTIEQLLTFWQTENLHIVLFAPFNRGKSTLINALLRQQKVLPVDSIPTTGYPIRIQYGEKPLCKITYKDGMCLESEDMLFLQQTTLNQTGKLNTDIVQTTLFYPAPLLQMGVTLFDLPGINDSLLHDRMAENVLIEADLVIQILDATQIGAASDTRSIENSLLGNDLKSILYVLNFVNKIEEAERPKIIAAAQAYVENFASDLSKQLPILYVLDLLAITNAIRKQALTALNKTEFPRFERILTYLAENKSFFKQKRLKRLKKYCQQIAATALQSATELHEKRLLILDDWQKKRTVLQADFNQAGTHLWSKCSELRHFYSEKNLILHYLEDFSKLFDQTNLEHGTRFDRHLNQKIQELHQVASYFWTHHQVQPIYIELIDPPPFPVMFPSPPSFDLADDIFNFLDGGQLKDRAWSGYLAKRKALADGYALKLLTLYAQAMQAGISKFQVDNETYFRTPRPIPEPHAATVLLKQMEPFVKQFQTIRQWK